MPPEFIMRTHDLVKYTHINGVGAPLQMAAHVAPRTCEVPMRSYPTVEDRFWAKVNKTETCWLWTATITQRSGYGQFALSQGKRIPAHRFAYELLVGPISAGLQLDHLCRVRRCVNPQHLEPVTLRENVLRGIQAQRPPAAPSAWTHCPHGHEYTTDNTYNAPDGRGRRCRVCRAAHRPHDPAYWREYRRKRRERAAVRQ